MMEKDVDWDRVSDLYGVVYLRVPHPVHGSCISGSYRFVGDGVRVTMDDGVIVEVPTSNIIARDVHVFDSIRRY